MYLFINVYTVYLSVLYQGISMIYLFLFSLSSVTSNIIVFFVSSDFRQSPERPEQAQGWPAGWKPGRRAEGCQAAGGGEEPPAGRGHDGAAERSAQPGADLADGQEAGPAQGTGPQQRFVKKITIKREKRRSIRTVNTNPNSHPWYKLVRGTS